MNLNVSTGIRFADTQNLMALRMSFDGATSLIFPIFYHDHCAISDISNTKKTTKEHQTSKERRHDLVRMPFDVCKSLTPICLISAYQTERLGYRRTSICQTCLSRKHHLYRSDRPFPNFSPIFYCISTLFVSNSLMTKTRLYRNDFSFP